MTGLDPFTGEPIDDARTEKSNSKGTRKGPELAPVPEPGQDERICAWLTGALALDREHPVAGGKHGGLAGPAGRVSLRRLGSRPIMFEPMSCICTVGKLRAALMCQRLPTDGEPPNVTQSFCDKVMLAVNRLCDHTAVIGAETETVGIVNAFLHAAERQDGHTTYGTSRQRYDAVMALRRSTTDNLDGSERLHWHGTANYLAEAHPDHDDELVIGVGDLQATARRVTGTSHPHGWLDGRMDDIGWPRFTLQGWAGPGRAGRKGKGSHAGLDVYRGKLPEDPQPPDEADDESPEVNT